MCVRETDRVCVCVCDRIECVRARERESKKGRG